MLLSDSVSTAQETIAKDTSWIGEGRKEIEDYLIRLNEANRHAFQQHPAAVNLPEGETGPLPPPPPSGPQVELVAATSKPLPPEPFVQETVRSNLEELKCRGGDLVSYWHKTTDRDQKYVSPYAMTKQSAGNMKHRLQEKYITFEPDVGGWNNIRMQMEVVLVFAAATGRTLVIPPEQAMVQPL